jgi:hypothetical protein
MKLRRVLRQAPIRPQQVPLFTTATTTCGAVANGEVPDDTDVGLLDRVAVGNVESLVLDPVRKRWLLCFLYRTRDSDAFMFQIVSRAGNLKKFLSCLDTSLGMNRCLPKPWDPHPQPLHPHEVESGGLGSAPGPHHPTLPPSVHCLAHGPCAQQALCPSRLTSVTLPSASTPKQRACVGGSSFGPYG